MSKSWVWASWIAGAILALGPSSSHETLAETPIIAAAVVNSEANLAAPSHSMSVMGRLLTCCEGSYESTQGEFVVDFVEPSLPWGSTVELRYGWRQLIPPTYVQDWTNTETVAMSSTAPYAWRAVVTEQVAAVSSPIRTDLQFVLIEHLPDGSTVYEKGSASRYGYYQVHTPMPNCVDDSEGRCHLPLQVVLKD